MLTRLMIASLDHDTLPGEVKSEFVSVFQSVNRGCAGVQGACHFLAFSTNQLTSLSGFDFHSFGGLSFWFHTKVHQRFQLLYLWQTLEK
jgi:hypothetical protein